ncbi:hypothetical protein BSLA_02r0003 [Burkholderia stabilis]|nr:hypothetical protein BSLA_02r0003 [Burkholderia stabilis]
MGGAVSHERCRRRNPKDTDRQQVQTSAGDRNEWRYYPEGLGLRFADSGRTNALYAHRFRGRFRAASAE